MTWLNPLALFGLFAVAVPIIVHLFGRRLAKRLRFPSLRLLPPSAPTPTTRSQPSDLLLLVVRCAIVVAGALALAQPLLMTRGRDRRAQVPARVIVLDTSASMQRPTSDGRTALDTARAMATALLDSAREGMVIETARPGRNVAAAASRLSSQSGKRELVVVSDFQLGALSDGDLAPLSAGVGLRLTKVQAPALAQPADSTSGGGVRFDGATTDATWAARPASGNDFGIAVLTNDSVGGRIATEAARTLVATADSVHAIEVVFPDYSGVPALRQQLEPLNEPWQGDFLLELKANHVLRSSRVANPTSCQYPGTVIVPNERGAPIATVSGAAGERVIVFSCSDIGTVASASLIAATMLANRNAVPFTESDPLTVPDSILRRWERPPTELAPGGREDTSPEGRWLWLVALILVGVEEWLRRRTSRRTAVVSAPEQRQRVA